MLCTDTALLYIPKASFTSCAKLCFGLRPFHLPFGLYQLLGLPFCKKLLNNWIFQKQVKANFQQRPTILLWTQQCYYTVLIRADKGWERVYFHGTLTLWFCVKTTIFTRFVLWYSSPWNCNSDPYIASSEAVTGEIQRHLSVQADEILRGFFVQIQIVYLVFQGFWFRCLYIYHLVVPLLLAGS